MIITTILGSPKRAGNTAKVLEAFERLAAADHEVFRIDIAEKTIGGCLGCYACQRSADAPGCRQDDDFGEVIARIMRSDLVVYSTPVYAWDFTAQMKTLVDRHFCLVKRKQPDATAYLLEGKRTMLLATCGGEASSNADLIQEVFKREMDYLRCRVAGIYIAGSCTAPAALGDKPETIARQMMEGLRRIA